MGSVILALIFGVLALYFELSRYKRYRNYVQKEFLNMLNVNAKNIILILYEILEKEYEDLPDSRKKMWEITKKIMGAIDHRFSYLANDSEELNKELFDLLQQDKSCDIVEERETVLAFLN